MSELKPCPFCGSRADSYQNPVGKHAIICSNIECGVGTLWMWLPVSAIGVWNLRAAGWINVHDHLPEWDDTVLAVCDGSPMQVMYEAEYGFQLEEPDNEIRRRDYVIHPTKWMYLPDPR